MTEITFKNNPIHLEGTEVSKGDVAPNFKVLDNSLNEVTLDNFKGQKKLISVVPSIDTGVCDQQTRKFSRKWCSTYNFSGFTFRSKKMVCIKWSRKCNYVK